MGAGVQKLDEESGEPAVSLVGKVEVRKENPVMVYACELTRLPFLVTLAKVRCDRK